MEYKLSYYTVITPCPDESGKLILFSTRTSRILIITEHCLSCIQQSRINEIPESVVFKLREIQALVPLDEEELLGIVTENIVEINKEDGILYEVIQPSANCQFGCYYCGQNHTKGELDPKMYKNLLGRIRDKAAKNNYKGLHIGWFGGEPLMALKTMRELTIELKTIAREFNLSYSAKIVTNGLSLKLNIYKELVSELNINNIEITLDGTEEYHDIHRYTKKGEGTFKIIFANLVSILNQSNSDTSKCGISIRCNVDSKNYQGVLPLLNLLTEKKIQDKINFYVTGIYSWGNDAHKGSLSKEEFAKKEIEWMAEMIKLKFNVKLIPKRKKQVCMAVSKNSEMYDAYGNIFNCTEVSYVSKYEESDYILSNLNNKTDQSKERPFRNWNKELLTDRFPCQTCRMLPVCGGACPKSWHEDMRACPSAKFNIEDRLKLSYIISKGENTEIIERNVTNFIKDSQ